MDSDMALDGNAVGGLLAEVFVGEATVVATRCHGCGATEPIGALRAYVNAPGAVLRCLHCDQVVLRVVRDGRRYWFDSRGCSWLQFDLRE
jgi:hypothetical protein